MLHVFFLDFRIGIYRGNKVNYIDLSFLLIEYFIVNNRILQYTSRNSVTLFSLATTDNGLA
jgi:hypothetical protein